MKKTVVITGASRGIGASCALLFAQNGYNVVINYNKSEEKAFELKERILSFGGNAICVKADVSRPDEAGSLISRAVEVYGQIDVLISNAGIALDGLITDVTDEQWEKIMAVNLNSVFYCARAAMPNMIKRKSGKIINISSMWGVCGASCEVAYSASKAGVIGFTKALAKEVGPSGITVNAIAPGVIDTDLNANYSKTDMDALCEETPLGRLGSPEEIAALALFLASDRADFITGQVIGANGGFVI